MLLRRNHVASEGPSGGHQEEEAPLHRPQAAYQRDELIQVVHVEAADGCVHLQRKARLRHQARDLEGHVKRAGKAPEGIVRLREGPVDAHRNAAHAGFSYAAQTLDCNQPRRGGSEGSPQALGGSIGEYLEEVSPHHRVAPGHDQDRVAELLDVVYQAESLLRRQLVWITPGLRFRPAVAAGEGTGAGQLPGDGER
jgi:hypothetical protein